VSDINTGKELMGQCLEMISLFITKGKSKDWYMELIKNMGGSGDYSHAASVSSLSGLIALGLLHPNPEDLALAGFLHDIALNDLPADAEKNFDTLTVKQKEEFRNHPLNAVKYLRTKRMAITPDVQKIIEQHHERPDGSGYPKGLDAAMISTEAYILSFADQFHELSEVVEGKKAKSAQEVFDLVVSNGSVSSDVLRMIAELFEFELNGAKLVSRTKKSINSRAAEKMAG